MKPKRCAIYTRKSTEEGLDQAFNSLDAQREACEAYALSQAGEGWTAAAERYDDGGWSGGTMDRPALRQLLDDVRAGKVDIIVVYKVDRLTRSLADFARIVDILDKAGASFVSVTQAFNTTNSMGRLTLNVLLSFAQFEREVTSERIRDKIAASKRKGMWMGGLVPNGYRLEGRTLAIDEAEAVTVRMLFERYLEYRSITRLVDALATEGVRTKVRYQSSGRMVGGVLFTRGSLSHLLQNPIYVGKVRHRGTMYEGQHDGLVDPARWDEVQQLLATNRNERRNGNMIRYPSLLTGMIGDPDGRAMTPVFTSRGSKRHHYYVTRFKSGETPITPWRVPAGEVDRIVLTIVAERLRSEPTHHRSLENIEARQQMAARLPNLSIPEQRELLIKQNVQVRLGRNTIEIDCGAIGERNLAPLPARHVRRGSEKRLVIESPADSPKVDPVLVRVVAQAMAVRASVLSGKPDSLVDHFSPRHRRRLLKLSFLAPDILSAIMAGRHPASLTSQRFMKAPDLPLDWPSQRRLIGL